ncbi:MAG: hypothetical protein LZF61_07860 [Nitrosomonas sp.]|nr:MAG: hypothetical protein LZF61_07860 [Nitrosomonas sp.]
MSRINDYSIQAELAQAAYGTFSEGAILPFLLTGDDVEMSTSQAAAFVENWQVAAQYGNGTGLSATAFESREDGIKYLVIRGSEPVANNAVSDLLLATGWSSNFNPQFFAFQI